MAKTDWRIKALAEDISMKARALEMLQNELERKLGACAKTINGVNCRFTTQSDGQLAFLLDEKRIDPEVFKHIIGWFQKHYSGLEVEYHETEPAEDPPVEDHGRAQA